MLTVGDVMTREVITVSPETLVSEVATILQNKRVSAVPVVDSAGAVVGIVSEGDLMGHVRAVGESPRRSWWLDFFKDTSTLAEHYAKTHGRTVSDVMTVDVVTTTEDQPLAEVARLMEKHRVKRLPVLRQKRLVGIVSRANLLQALAVAGPGEGATADDRVIAQSLVAELADKAWGRSTSVIVEDGIVHLWGFVENESERRAVRVAAEQIAGVKSVEDHTVFRPVHHGL